MQREHRKREVEAAKKEYKWRYTQDDDEGTEMPNHLVAHKNVDMLPRLFKVLPDDRIIRRRKDIVKYLMTQYQEKLERKR